jgi:hypothetical protein
MLLAGLFALLFSAGMNAQTRMLITDRAVIKDSIQIAGRWVYLVSPDSTFSNADHRSVPTTKAVKDFVESLPSGVSDFYVSNDTLYLITEDSTYFALLPDGADDWGTQVVERDSTLRGNGTVGDPLRVNRDSFPTLASVAAKLNIADTTSMLAPYAQGSGVVNFFPIWTGTRTLARSILQQPDTNHVSLATKPIRLGTWTTAGQPATPFQGYLGYNTTNNTPTWYNGTSWVVPAQSASATGLFTAQRMAYSNSTGQITVGQIVVLGDTAINAPYLKINNNQNLYQSLYPVRYGQLFSSSERAAMVITQNASTLVRKTIISLNSTDSDRYAIHATISSSTVNNNTGDGYTIYTAGAGGAYHNSFSQNTGTFAKPTWGHHVNLYAQNTNAIQISNNTANHFMYNSTIQFVGDSIRLANVYRYAAQHSNFSAGSKVTNQYVYWTNLDTSSTTNLFPFMQTGLGGNNIFAGRLRIGSTSIPNQRLHVTGKIQVDTLTDTPASLAAWTGTSGSGVLTRAKIGAGLAFSNDTLRNTVTLPSYQTIADSVSAYLPTGGGSSIYTDSGTVAPIADMLVRTRPDTTFSIGQCIGCTGFENFWDNYAPNTEFSGISLSPSYWLGTTMQHAEISSNGKLKYSEILSRNLTGSTESVILSTWETDGSTRSASIRTLVEAVNLDTLPVVKIAGEVNGDGFEYSFPTQSPSNTNKSIMVWDGNSNSSTFQYIDTLIKFDQSDYNIGTLLATNPSRFNKITCLGSVPSGASSNAQLLLGSPSSSVEDVEIIVWPNDGDTTYGVSVSGGVNEIAFGDGTYTNSFSCTAGKKVTIRAIQDPLASNAWKWFIF